MQLFMVHLDWDMDKALWITAKHSGLALWEASKILELDKLEMLDMGYEAFPVPNKTDNGYDINTKKAKVTAVS